MARETTELYGPEDPITVQMVRTAEEANTEATKGKRLNRRAGDVEKATKAAAKELKEAQAYEEMLQDLLNRTQGALEAKRQELR